MGIAGLDTARARHITSVRRRGMAQLSSGMAQSSSGMAQLSSGMATQCKGRVMRASHRGGTVEYRTAMAWLCHAELRQSIETFSDGSALFCFYTQSCGNAVRRRGMAGHGMCTALHRLSLAAQRHSTAPHG